MHLTVCPELFNFWSGSGTRLACPIEACDRSQVESTGCTEHMLRPAWGRNVDPVPGRWWLAWGYGPHRRLSAFARSVVVQDRAEAAVPGEQRIVAEPEQ